MSLLDSARILPGRDWLDPQEDHVIVLASCLLRADKAPRVLSGVDYADYFSCMIYVVVHTHITSCVRPASQGMCLLG